MTTPTEQPTPPEATKALEWMTAPIIKSNGEPWPGIARIMHGSGSYGSMNEQEAIALVKGINAALVTERDFSAKLQEDIANLNNQLAGGELRFLLERDRLNATFKDMASQIDQLRNQLADERERHAEEMEQWHARFNQLQKQLDREQATMLDFAEKTGKQLAAEQEALGANIKTNVQLREQLAAAVEALQGWQNYYPNMREAIDMLLAKLKEGK